ncbi:MAG TPA: carboxypeptidase regulatory-like domain-containing protein [Myxococcaceae bacterium]|nr:carboxypeptidase regulatory-like domain-containing protein [Myxococcaceae bacterium]
MSRPLLCTLLSWVLAGAAWAGDPAASLEGQTRLDLDVTLANRDSTQQGLGTTLKYAGVATPAYLRLAATHFIHPVLGVSADVGVDLFGVNGDGFRGYIPNELESAFTIAGGVVARVRPVDALSVEGQAGYLFAQLATLAVGGPRDDVIPANVSFSGPHLGVQLRYDFDLFGPLTAQAGTRWIPLGLGVSVPGGSNQVAPWQLQVNAGLSYRALSFGPMQVAFGAGYEYAVAAASTTSSRNYILVQRSHRFGLTVRTWLVPPADMKGLDRSLPSGPGRIHGLVVREGNAPIPGAKVEVPGKDPVLTGVDGSFALEKVPPGPLEMTVTAAGFKARAESVNVAPGGELKLTVTLQAPTGPGRIRGTAFAAAAQQGGAKSPLADVTIEGPRGAVRAGADGTFTLDAVGPGPVQVKATLKGYKPAEEVVSVPPEGEAAVELTLVKESAKVLASMRGQVRTLRGKPVSALLKIPEAQISTRTGPDGRFTVRLPGGKYTVVFEAPGYVRQTKTVEVADGDQAIFYVDLSREDR